MAGDAVLEVDQVSKKYCRTLQHSMLYAVQDLFLDIFGRVRQSAHLRPHEFWAVDEVSFELKQGECLGLIGANGAGKSTLLKMINGVVRPDRGSIKVRGRIGALIELGAGFHPQLTGRENIYVNAAIIGMSKKETDEKLDRIIEFADLGDFLDTPVKFYSSGMGIRLGMAIALNTDPTILLIDEVLTVGDIKFQARCLSRVAEMRKQGVAFIFVSHIHHHIAGFSDRVLVLDHGKPYAYGETEHAIGQYLQLMDVKMGADWNPDDRRPGPGLPNGSGLIRILDTRFYDDDGNRVESIEATTPVSLVIGYEAAMDINDVLLDVDIFDKKRMEFFQVTNVMLNQRLDVAKGNGSLVVRLPYLPLNNGQLEFSLCLWSKRKHELFDWREQIHLDVRGCALSSGAVWLPCSFQALGYRYDPPNPGQTQAGQGSVHETRG